MTVEQQAFYSTARLMTHEGRRNWIQYEIRRELADAPSKPCNCGCRCSSRMCVDCWREMLEVEYK
jgi:hypothetical protein